VRESLDERLGGDEAAAWSGMAANLLVLPGLGSLMAGRKVGWLQAVLASSGALLSLLWLVSFVRACIRLGAVPLDAGPDLGVGLAGIAAFGVAWLWALVTSLDVVRRARVR
jgi:hypothetical protein